MAICMTKAIRTKKRDAPRILKLLRFFFIEKSPFRCVGSLFQNSLIA